MRHTAQQEETLKILPQIGVYCARVVALPNHGTVPVYEGLVALYVPTTTTQSPIKFFKYHLSGQ